MEHIFTHLVVITVTIPGEINSELTWLGIIRIKSFVFFSHTLNPVTQNRQDERAGCVNLKVH